MTYLGRGHRGSGLGSDELKVLQQVNGGENICVFRGLVTPGGRRTGQNQHRGAIILKKMSLLSESLLKLGWGGVKVFFHIKEEENNS